LGWKGAKAPTYVRYRVHEQSMLEKAKRSPSWQYAKRAMLLESPITIFTPFAGRREVLDRYIEGLKNLDFDPTLIRLHWFDTSGSKDFGHTLRMELANLPFGRTTYTADPLPPSWGHTPQSLIQQRVSDKDHAQYFYELVLVRAYNHLLTSCDTEYALTVEDDILLAPHVLKEMLEAVTEDSVAVVAPYRCLLRGFLMPWRIDYTKHVSHFTELGIGVGEVHGSGFGCSLFRMSALKKTPIFTKIHATPRSWYDHIAFAHLRTQGKILCHWGCEVEHMETERFLETPENEKREKKKQSKQREHAYISPV